MKILNTYVGSDVCISGTSLMGHVNATYAELVKAFGEPTEHDGDKFTVAWNLEFRIGRGEKGLEDIENLRATVYDWKTMCTPFEGYDWHIGGDSPRVVRLVEHKLGFVHGQHPHGDDVCV
tara:strand:- start:23 stop:382 length:360 start_codon:yes stop_codon:yes gene_type:complete